MSEELFDRIRGLSQKAIDVAVPSEAELFGAVWVGCEPWVRSVWATAPGQWSLGEYRDQVGSSLGVINGVDALDLVSPKVVATITAVLHVLTRTQRPSAGDAIRYAEQYAPEFSIKNEKVVEAICTVLAADVEVLAAPGTLGVRGAAKGSFTLYDDGHPDGIEISAEQRKELVEEPERRRLVADVNRSRLWLAGEPVSVKPEVFDTVVCLLKCVGRLCHYETISWDVWGHRWDRGVKMRRNVQRRVEQFHAAAKARGVDLRPWFPKADRKALGYEVHATAHGEPDGEPLSFGLIDLR